MTLAELKDQLVTSGLPVAYDHFPETECPNMPFVVFRVKGTHNFSADNSVYEKIQSVEVELCTVTKDLVSETALETALDGFYWEMSASFAEAENSWATIYEISV